MTGFHAAESQRVIEYLEMKPHQVETHRRETALQVQRHNEEREAHKSEWWAEWGRKQQEAQIAQTLGTLTIQSESQD